MSSYAERIKQIFDTGQASRGLDGQRWLQEYFDSAKRIPIVDMRKIVKESSMFRTDKEALAFLKGESSNGDAGSS